MHNDDTMPKTVRLRRNNGMIDLTPAPILRRRGRAKRVAAFDAVLTFLADPRLAWALTGAIAATVSATLVIIWNY